MARSVTEFWNFTLFKGISAKAALAGKTPEEIQQSLGETFKMEGDKLKHFINAVDVAEKNQEKLSRVLVVALAEGEAAPTKGVKVEEHYYIPDFQNENKAPVSTTKPAPQRGGGKDKGKKPKESPWGLSPEEKAAKKAGGAATKAKAAAEKPKAE